MFYPLAAECEAEMSEWINILQRAIAGEVEESDGPSMLGHCSITLVNKYILRIEDTLISMGCRVQ